MISMPHIPVAVEPARLAGQAGVAASKAASFLKEALPSLAPAGVFDEVELPTVLGPFRPEGPEWEAPGIIGLLSLGLMADRPWARHDEDKVLREVLTALALRQGLDFFEYRLRNYLKPTGRHPGPRLVPGCPEMPLAANRAILAYFGPEHALGLELAPSGEIAGRAGLALLYPTLARPADLESRCARCTRQECPARPRYE